ncbi:MAG: hypothetical protein IKI30_03475 [Oxalobacter sp.]|nr:hypothetical protein [Oxalobacter sp.]
MKHSKWALFGIAALCAGMLVGCGKPSKEQVVEMAAKELGKNVPQQLDSVTTLTKAEANNGTLNLYYTISRPDAQLHAAEAEMGIRSNIIEQYCYNDQNKPMREMGIEVQHNYTDSTGAALFTIKADPSQCTK